MKQSLSVFLISILLATGGVSQAQTGFLPAGHSGVWGGVMGNSSPSPNFSGYEFAFCFRGRVTAGIGMDDSGSFESFPRWGLLRYSPLNSGSVAGRGLEIQASFLRNPVYVGKEHDQYQVGVCTFQRVTLAPDWRFLASLGALFRWGDNWVRPVWLYPDGPFQNGYVREFGDWGLQAAGELLFRDLVFGALDFSYSQQDYADYPVEGWARNWGLRVGFLLDLTKAK